MEARMMRLLKRNHIEAALRQQNCGRAAGGATTDHSYVT